MAKLNQNLNADILIQFILLNIVPKDKGPKGMLYCYELSKLKIITILFPTYYLQQH